MVGLDWRRHQLDADRLAASVVDAAADVVIVSGIPDEMVNGPLETFTAGHEPARGVGDALDDVALGDIARQAGRELTLRPSIGDVPGRLDALFCRPGVEPPGLRAEDGDPSAPRSNEPERGSLAGTLIPRIRSELERRLPDYMTPARFVVMPELPTLPSGKIDRTALPTPSLHRSARVTPLVEPIDRLEELLVEVWQAVTGVDAVGTHDDFFGELGGHSLLAARLAARLRSVLDTDVPLQLVFDTPTIVAMASALRGSSRLAVDIDGEAEIPPPPPAATASGKSNMSAVDQLARTSGACNGAIARADRPDELPLSFAQQRLWFLDRLAPGNPFYVETSAFRLRGAIQPRALEMSLGAVADRHEILRTSFANVDGRPLQRIAPSTRVPLELVDLTVVAPARRDDELDRIVLERATTPFDLTTARCCGRPWCGSPATTTSSCSRCTTSSPMAGRCRCSVASCPPCTGAWSRASGWSSPSCPSSTRTTPSGNAPTSGRPPSSGSSATGRSTSLGCRSSNCRPITPARPRSRTAAATSASSFRPARAPG